MKTIMSLSKNLINFLNRTKEVYFIICITLCSKIVAFAATGDAGLGDIEETFKNKDLTDGIGTDTIAEMVRAIIVEFDITAAFYDVMCWISLFITAALGIKQLFIKTDEDSRGGGFWNVLKIAGWGIAGLLGIIIKSALDTNAG
jgi:hypothetical protein